MLMSELREVDIKKKHDVKQKDAVFSSCFFFYEIFLTNGDKYININI